VTASLNLLALVACLNVEEQERADPAIDPPPVTPTRRHEQNSDYGADFFAFILTAQLLQLRRALASIRYTHTHMR
jgi:hypothetical protein